LFLGWLVRWDDILEGPTLPEPVRLIQVTPLGQRWRVLAALLNEYGQKAYRF